MPEFVHLHNHTHYSLLDGACTPEQLVNAAYEEGQKSVALTDHGVMFGCYDFYKKAKKKGIKPIIGCEIYIANGSRRDTNLISKGVKKKNYYHMVLLAKNEIGYKNLMKLSTLGHTEGFYYKPRIDTDLLEEYHEGIIGLSACLGGVINAHLINGDYEMARKNAIWYKELMGDDFYLELQHHNLEGDEIVMAQVPKLAKELGIKLVATNDCHYIKQEHAVAHNVLLHIKDVNPNNAGKIDIHNLRYGKPEMYFRSGEEMAQIFKDFPDSIENSLEIAEKCNVEIKSGLHMPEFPIPAESKSENLNDYLEELTLKGLDRRYPVLKKDVEDRAAFELNVIKNMGFAGYFLIVQDFIAAARGMGVRVGPGRGSAAGSLVAYALGITNVDPIPYDLLFERFLNPDRVSMPDIDIDFSDDKREMVIDYVREKYGKESVAQIITFGTLSSRAVLKDIGRVLGIPLSTINSITEKIPVILGKVTPVAKAIELPELRWVKESDDPKIKQLIEYAMVLEGFCRNTSIHAAGVVIAPGDISQYVPLYKTPSSEVATQYTMKDLEDAGLLKMDFLGLRTLSIIDNTLAMIEHNHDIKIDIDEIDFTDAKTYELLGKGQTLSVFQFESDPMQDALRGLKPNSLEDLTAMNALYRPGPMDNIPDFIDRKHGRKQIEYMHPLMEKSLDKTYGIIVYQEQVMQLVRDLAGFTLAQADIMRRAMGKKDEKLMIELKSQFVDGALTENQIGKKLAEEIFDLILKFASYGFNKSHSLAYSYLAYQTAWLKAHYTAEFLAANMTAELNDLDKIVRLIDEAKNFNIEVLAPDVNESFATFTVSGKGNIIFGLAGIKGVGINAVESIVKAREEKPFTTFFDFVTRVDSRLVNRRALEALICAGAFDCLRTGYRAQLFAAVETALEFAKAQSAGKSTTMDSLFGEEEETSMIVEPKLPNVPEWKELERLEHEKEVLNFYLSGHPLHRYGPHVNSFATLQLGKKDSPLLGETVRVCGLITAIRTRLDKRENTIAFVSIEDFSGKAECIMWSETYKKYAEFLKEDTAIYVKGKSEKGSDPVKIIVDEICPLEDVVDKFAKGYHVYLKVDSANPEQIHQIASLKTDNMEIKTKLKFSLINSDNILYKQYTIPQVGIPISNESTDALMKIFGRQGVKFMLE